jgi:hypothetical protein
VIRGNNDIGRGWLRAQLPAACSRVSRVIVSYLCCEKENVMGAGLAVSPCEVCKYVPVFMFRE